MAKPLDLTTKTCLIQLWCNFCEFLLTLRLIAPLRKLFCRFQGNKEDLQTVSSPDESSEYEGSSDVSVVTSKTDFEPEQAPSESTPIPASDSEEEEAVIDWSISKTTAQEVKDELFYIHHKLDDLSSIVYKLQSAVGKEYSGKGVGDAGTEATSFYTSAEFPPEDDGDGDCEAGDGITEHLLKTPDVDGNLTEIPSGNENTAEEDVAAETVQTVDQSSRKNPMPTGRPQFFEAEERALASEDCAGTSDKGRPPDSDDQSLLDSITIDSGPPEMLLVEQYPAIFWTMNSGPPDTTFGALRNPAEKGRPHWDDSGGMNGDVDSGPQEMLFGLLRSYSNSQCYLKKYGDHADDDLDDHFHGSDVCFGDDQLPRDAWDLESSEEMATKGFIISAMQHVSKPPGKDPGTDGEDVEGLHSWIAAEEKENGPCTPDLAPRKIPAFGLINSSDAQSYTPNMDCG